MILPIYTEPNPVLHAVAEPVTEITPEIRELAQNMRETMHNAKGIGLAAPQIGKLLSLCVVELEADKEDEGIPFMALVNPRITWKSTKLVPVTEACLSIPGVEGDVLRPDRVRVKAKDLDGATLSIEASGLLARVLQHEIDHLNGILFTSYVRKKDLHHRDLVDYPQI